MSLIDRIANYFKEWNGIDEKKEKLYEVTQMKWEDRNKNQSILDIGRLAEAISIKKPDISCSVSHTTIRADIRLNPVLFITVHACRETSPAHRYVMSIGIYVEDILTEGYDAILDIRESPQFYREWKKEKELIKHPLPQCFVKELNTWSETVIAEYESHRKQRKEEITKSRQEREEYEKFVLAKYYD